MRGRSVVQDLDKTLICQLLLQVGADRDQIQNVEPWPNAAIDGEPLQAEHRSRTLGNYSSQPQTVPPSCAYIRRDHPTVVATVVSPHWDG